MAREPGAASLARFLGFFFVFGGFGGVYTVYLPPYLKSLGFSSTERGQLLAIGPLLMCIAPVAWAQLADRRGARLQLVRALLAALAAAFALLYAARSGAALAVALTLVAALRAGVLPLADALALSALPSARYVLVVVASGASWIAAIGLFSAIAADAPGRESWVLGASHALIGAALVASLLLRAPPQPPAARASAAAARALLADRRLRRFLAALVLYWISMGPFETLLALHAEAAGFGASAGGYAFGVAIAAEIAVLLAARRPGLDLLGLAGTDRARSRRWLTAVMLATAARWSLTAIAPHPAAFLALQLVHGLSFGAFFLLAVGELKVLVPESLRATGQALLVAATAGGGAMLGALLTGLADDLGGSSLAFHGAAVAALLAAALLAAHPRDPLDVSARDASVPRP
jgi:PPP family 3-phenylpropionic acid transporter